MITYSTFPKGRIGNNLFELAALNAFAKRYNTTWAIPKWEHSHLFENPLPELDQLPTPTQKISERKFAYDQEYFDQFDYQQVVDLQGYFQNQKYFDPEETKRLLKFKPEILENLYKKYDYLFTRPTIAIGVRRGDYVDNPNYYQLPVRYYIQALQKFDFKNYNIVFFSDDLQWCYFHFRSVNHAFFPKFESAIESFMVGTLMQNWIISNSTYHWWASYLSNAERVIQPAHLFDGELLKKEGPVNFYIENERFEIYDHELEKINLRDTTFTIPCKCDHEDRRRNIETSVRLLLQDFDTNIVVGEQGGTRFESLVGVEYINFNNLEHFHRTAMLNWMASEATTPIVANYDTDVLLAPMQIVTAVNMIRDGKADFVYPYEYQFIRVHKRDHHKLKNDLAVFMNTLAGDETKTRPSVGGAVLFNKEKFLEVGGENERFVSFGPEDVERYERFIRLNLRNKRVRGPLYHLNHFVGVDSSQKNPFYQDGVYELIKQREMTNDELKEYVATWK